MAILKIRDENGNIVEIAAIKGEKGDPGDPANMDEINVAIENAINSTGIASIEQTTTSTEDGGTNIITATLKSGVKSTFTIRNGNKGDKGDKGEDYVLTAADKAEIVASVLSAANIAYVGSAEPTSNIGNDGDIYIVTE